MPRSVLSFSARWKLYCAMPKEVRDILDLVWAITGWE